MGMMKRFQRPIIQPSSDSGDCGYMCILAALAVRGRPVLVESLKRFIGRTNRGLSIRQVRNGLVACGFSAEAIFFKKSRMDSVPVPGLLLCDQGHWIFVLRSKGHKFEIYDPIAGWSWQRFSRIRRRANGLGISFEDFWSSPLALPADDTDRAVGQLNRKLIEALRGRQVWIAALVFLFAQIFILALPLVSMWSADMSSSGLTTNLIATASLAFLLLSVTNISITLSGNLLHSKVRRLNESALGLMILKALKKKSAEWFERNPPAILQNKISSVGVVSDFYVGLVRSVAVAAVSLAAGVYVLFFVAPSLILPGLISLAISIGLDLSLQRYQHNFISSHVGSTQSYQRFVLETLSQFPMFVRFDATDGVARRHRTLTRQKGAMQAQLQAFQSWNASIIGLVKSAESLIFVTLAASLLGAGEFAIGGFVALGAYKDLLSSALSSFFRMGMDYRSLAVHRMQAATLFDDDRVAEYAPIDIQRGDIHFEAVSFRYGTFDEPVLKDLTLHIRAGELTVLQGRSGLGKSTIAKLALGQLTPELGRVTFDDCAASATAMGVASIFQTDPLIHGSIRENLTLFDRRYAEDEIWAALEAAQLDEFVRGLPMKLATQVGEGIGGLSGGQKQRLLIARALVLKPKVLVLDEATSALDVQTERKIFEHLRSLGCTILAIAHRPEVAQLADRVFELTSDQTIHERQHNSISNDAEIVRNNSIAINEV